MVDIGGTPIRFYTIFREFLVDLYGVPIEFIEENIDIIHEVQNAMLLQKQLVPFGSKYMTLSFLNSVLVSKNIPILF